MMSKKLISAFALTSVALSLPVLATPADIMIRPAGEVALVEQGLSEEHPTAVAKQGWFYPAVFYVKSFFYRVQAPKPVAAIDYERRSVTPQPTKSTSVALHIPGQSPIRFDVTLPYVSAPVPAPSPVQAIPLRDDNAVMVRRQANPTPSADNGVTALAIREGAPVQHTPGTQGVVPLLAYESKENVDSAVVAANQLEQKGGELELADLYHSPSGGGVEPVYLACYSEPNYEPSKGYKVAGNYRVQGFIRVAGQNVNGFAIPDGLEDSDHEVYGRDISNKKHMYSNLCNNFLETCMSFNKDGELVKNCWAGGDTGGKKNELDRAYGKRYALTWE